MSKDKDEPNDRHGAVDNIKCCDCQASDIGETNGRRKMVMSTITLLNTMHLHTNHEIEWDSTEYVTYSTDYYKRLTLESWFTNLEQTPLNRCQHAASYIEGVDRG